jgi:hypothetical protein
MATLRFVRDGGVEGAAPCSALPVPAVVRGFQESARYTFSLERPGIHHLVVDDVALETDVQSDCQRWYWQPRFYAGTVVAELLDEHGNHLASYHLDVAPAPDKLGQDFFQQVVEDLRLTGPEWLLGTESAQQAFGESGNVMSVHLAYARLKRFGPAYVEALRRVRARPLSVLRSERRLVPPHGVRRIDARTLQAVVRSPGAAAEISRRRHHAVAGGVLYDVPVSREDVNSPAHHILLNGMLAVIRRIRWVREELARLAATRTMQARTPMAPRLAVRTKLLGELEDGLREICRSTPFSAVSRRETTAAGLNVISGHPVYARAFRLGWQTLRSGVEGDTAEELFAISPTWEIYERWCFLQVVKALQALFPGLSWKRKKGSSVDRVRVAGKCGSLSIDVHLQRTFPAVDRRTDDKPFYSISAERRPDIVVTWQSASSAGMAVFDAKYRVARQYVLEAMESAHIYKDCLRWQGKRPEFAMLLVPAAGGVPCLEDAAFHAEHKVGAIPLFPGIGHETLTAFLDKALSGIKPMHIS